jgi:hypothetical protein
VPVESGDGTKAGFRFVVTGGTIAMEARGMVVSVVGVDDVVRLVGGEYFAVEDAGDTLDEEAKRPWMDTFGTVGRISSLPSSNYINCWTSNGATFNGELKERRAAKISVL